MVTGEVAKGSAAVMTANAMAVVWTAAVVVAGAGAAGEVVVVQAAGARDVVATEAASVCRSPCACERVSVL